MAAPAPSRFVLEKRRPSPAERRAAARMVARERERLGAHTASTAPQLSEPEVQPQVRPRSRSRPAQASARPRLHVVKRRRPWVLPLLLFAVVTAAAVLVGPAFLTTGMRLADTQRSRLEVRATNLVAEQAALRARAATLTAAPRIKTEAEKLGMVPADAVQYVSVPAGSGAVGSTAEGGGSASDSR
jgi:hypothetical protein